MEAGISAWGLSENKATPEGRESTPAPMMLFARLKVEVAMLAPSPGLVCGATSAAVIATLPPARVMPPRAALEGECSECTETSSSNPMKRSLFLIITEATINVLARCVSG